MPSCHCIIPRPCLNDTLALGHFTTHMVHTPIEPHWLHGAGGVMSKHQPTVDNKAEGSANCRHTVDSFTTSKRNGDARAAMQALHTRVNEKENTKQPRGATQTNCGRHEGKLIPQFQAVTNPHVVASFHGETHGLC